MAELEGGFGNVHVHECSSAEVAEEEFARIVRLRKILNETYKLFVWRKVFFAEDLIFHVSGW